MHAVIAGDPSGGTIVVTDTAPDDAGGPVAASPTVPGAYFLGTFGDIGQGRGAWVSRCTLGGAGVWRVTMMRLPLSNMDMVIDADGGVHVLGETNDPVVAGQPDRGAFDAFVLSIADLGRGEVTRRWQNRSAGDEHPMALAVDPCGRLYVAGSTTGRMAGDPARGQRDAFLLEVRRAGGDPGSGAR